jgi:hypothetical protein
MDGRTDKEAKRLKIERETGRERGTADKKMYRQMGVCMDRSMNEETNGQTNRQRHTDRQMD